MSNRFLSSIPIIAFFLIPAPLFAAVVFTEAMYDVPGADTGREWVEIQNMGSTPVDLAGWKLFENATNHKIIPQRSTLIAPGAYAVIAANAAKFSADWPAYGGLLFQSSFSLSNTGEALVLKDASSTEMASLAYDTSIGAAGDGNSLNASGGAWIVRKPSPGSALSSDTISPPPPKIAPSKISSRNPSTVSKVPISDSKDTSGAVSISGTDQLAATAVASEGPNAASGIIPWIVALGAIVVIAGAAIFFKPAAKANSGYTITEEKS